MDNMNMKVRDLKYILKDLPDDMDVIIPILSEDANRVYKFIHVRTAGILASEFEEDCALCLSSNLRGLDISSQVANHIQCKKVLF